MRGSLTVGLRELQVAEDAARRAVMQSSHDRQECGNFSVERGEISGIKTQVVKTHPD
jgi:hypothetical protein